MRFSRSFSCLGRSMKIQSPTGVAFSIYSSRHGAHKISGINWFYLRPRIYGPSPVTGDLSPVTCAPPPAILYPMRSWLLLVLAAILVGTLGCTSDVHPAIRDGQAQAPTADSGAIAQGTTGGDAAGTLNLDANHQGEESEGREGGR